MIELNHFLACFIMPSGAYYSLHYMYANMEHKGRAWRGGAITCIVYIIESFIYYDIINTTLLQMCVMMPACTHVTFTLC